MAPPEWLTDAVVDIPDFPEPGIMFKDLSPLWRSAADTSRCAVALASGLEDIDVVVGIEARGFLAGLITAQRLGVGFVAARKPGKLPGRVESIDYQLEYGSDRLEMQAGSVTADDRVVIVDDVIATGGTAAATAELVTRLGASVVEVRSVIELAALGGRARIEPHRVHSLWEVH
jgi:adenine phosphoribosyltransferase